MPEPEQRTDLNLPSLHTERLFLRAFIHSDVDEVQRICSDKRIAANTRTVPHPYPPGTAANWIRQHDGFWRSGKAAIFAICLSEASGSKVIGAIGLEVTPEDEQGELGYWIDESFREQGYATEAALKVIEFGFEQMGLFRIFATHYLRNPASGRVLEKLGMRKEGVLRGSVKKWGVFEDIVIYGVLRSDSPVS